MRISAEFGRGNTIRDIELPAGATVRTLKQNQRVRVGLQLTENVNALVDGQVLEDTAELGDGDHVVFETRVGQKANVA